MDMRGKMLIVGVMLLGVAGMWLAGAAEKVYKVGSPDGRTEVTVSAGAELRWEVARDGRRVLAPSALALRLAGEPALGAAPRVRSARVSAHDATFETPFYKKASVRDRYNLLTLTLNGGWSVEFRAYDSGVAYRFVTARKGEITVEDEEVAFNFDGDYKVFVPYVNDNRGGERYCYSFESYYTEGKMSEMVADSLAIVPLIVDLGGGRKAAVMEAGIEDYPGMFLKINTQTRRGLVSEFAPYPLEYGRVGGNMVPLKRAGYIARTGGTRTFPWRVLVIADRDADLANNDLAQCLAPESRLSDTSWIRPGKVAWEWWSARYLTGVDFKVGATTEFYKYFADFAAAFGLEYILLDGGWSGASLMEPRPGLDIAELVRYAEERGVGVILWAYWASAETQAAEAFPYYAKMGVKGFKVDFFDADDQRIVKGMYELAALAAENHLVLDLHGMKPFGIQRAYPNVLNFEGVKGLENAKWTGVRADGPVDDIPRYDVTAPYARMLLGPMDYTPGAMDNATRAGYRAINADPMSQGTRVHQMAMYTAFEAPLQMMADSPSKYLRERECAEFIAKVPTVFDETVVMDGEVGEYLVIARRKGETWYLAAMTDWTPRDLEIDLSFLGGGSYAADIFEDGVNAASFAEDYGHTHAALHPGDRLGVHLAPGGGWTAILTRVSF